MKILALILLTIFFFPSIMKHETITIDKKEAQKAFGLLQEIRSNPNKYYNELGFNENENVSPVILRWNDTLAKVAEEKVYDMASRDYFAHVNPEGYGINYFINESGFNLEPQWIDNKSNNYFESISAGDSSGEAAIKGLVEDRGTPGLGHRIALLGLNDWNRKATDIGIGFAKCDTCRYKTLTCVIVARHSW